MLCNFVLKFILILLYCIYFDKHGHNYVYHCLQQSANVCEGMIPAAGRSFFNLCFSGGRFSNTNVLRERNSLRRARAILKHWCTMMFLIQYDGIMASLWCPRVFLYCFVQLYLCPFIWYWFFSKLTLIQVFTMKVKVKSLANLGTHARQGLLYCCELINRKLWVI